MKKGIWTKVIIGIMLLLGLVALGIFRFSLIHFPFRNPVSSLNSHLSTDFGMVLPAGATIPNAYWVGSHDPEEDFDIRVPPDQVKSFLQALEDAAQRRGLEFVLWKPREDGNGKVVLDTLKPGYGAPPWWNNPPIAGKWQFTIMLKGAQSASITQYAVLASEADGRIYISWGGN